MTAIQYNEKNIKSFQKRQEVQLQQFYQIRIKRLTIEQTKECHLKKLCELFTGLSHFCPREVVPY
jgi:hypothetical protein